MITPNKYGSLQRANKNFVKITKPHIHMSHDDFMSILDYQARKCAICHVKAWLVVDHDHDTGLIRGLVCNECNWLIGRCERGIERNYTVDCYLNYCPTTALSMKHVYKPYKEE